MRLDQEYVAIYFCKLLDVKISRTKVVLKELVDLGKIDLEVLDRQAKKNMKISV